MNVDNPTASSAISTQTDVTASRVTDGTVYQNTSTKPIFCVVTCELAISGVATAKCDASVTPTTTVSRITSTVVIDGSLTFWVLPGYYYSVNQTNGTKVSWIEYT